MGNKELKTPLHLNTNHDSLGGILLIPYEYKESIPVQESIVLPKESVPDCWKFGLTQPYRVDRVDGPQETERN